MKKLAAVMISLALVIPAMAHEHVIIPPPKVVAPKPPPAPVNRSGFGSGLWIAGGTVGCASLGLIGYGAYVANTQHRELTCREANMVAFGCIIPFVGAYLVDAAWKADPSLEAKCKVKY